jgi:hypothetical protein
MNRREIPMPALTEVPPVIGRCLALDPAARPTATQVAEELG